MFSKSKKSFSDPLRQTFFICHCLTRVTGMFRKVSERRLGLPWSAWTGLPAGVSSAPRGSAGAGHLGGMVLALEGGQVRGAAEQATAHSPPPTRRTSRTHAHIAWGKSGAGAASSERPTCTPGLSEQIPHPGGWRQWPEDLSQNTGPPLGGWLWFWCWSARQRESNREANLSKRTHMTSSHGPGWGGGTSRCPRLCPWVHRWLRVTNGAKRPRRGGSTPEVLMGFGNPGQVNMSRCYFQDKRKSERCAHQTGQLGREGSLLHPQNASP